MPLSPAAAAIPAAHVPRQFADPEYFDIHRDIERHVGLGFGIHLCVGAALARLETLNLGGPQREVARVDLARREDGRTAAYRELFACFPDRDTARATNFCFAQRAERVGRFAGLRDRDGQRPRIHDRIAVPELRAVIDFDGEVRQFLDQKLADEPRVP